MNSTIPVDRRKFIVLSGAFTGALSGAFNFLMPSARSGAVPDYGVMDRYTLDVGHRGSRGGPVTALADGSLLWVTTEPEPPYISKAMWQISRLTMRRSVDGGRSWGAPRNFVHGTKDYSLLSHTLRLSASGALIHVFVRYSGYDYDTHTPAKSLCEAFVHRSVDGGRTWSEPVKLPTAERYIGDVMSLEQLRDGRLIYPFCFLTAIKSQFACSALYSDDDGQSWTRSQSILKAGGGGFESGASEPTVVELPDGRLWMLIRAQTGFLWESFSSDRGKTWSTAAPSLLPSSNAPATALRLRSGDIAVAWNNHVQSTYARQSLVLGLTRDGRTFRGLRELDFTDYADNPAEPTQHVTYPYLTETTEGLIFVSYNKGLWMRHNRPSLARINPIWLLARHEMADFRDGRTGWHTVNPGPDRVAAVERYVAAADELWLELEQATNHKEPAGITRNIPLVADGEIHATVQVVRPEAYLLFSDTLLHPNNITESCLRIRWAGDQILLAAGTPERKQNDRQTMQYSFLSHTIKTETPYPQPPKSNEVIEVWLRYQAAQSKAEIRINGGPVVELRTGPALGLSSVGLAVGGGGLLRVKSVRTDLK